MLPEKEQARLAQQIREANERRGTPLQADALKFMANALFDMHRAYVTAGFTEQQALYLVTYKS